MLGKIDKTIATVLRAVAILCSLSLAGFLLLLVLARYVFGWNFAAAHDLSLMASIFLYMSGALIASRSSEHLTVTYLSTRLRSERSRIIQRIVVATITTVVCGFFIYWSYEMVSWGLQRPQTTVTLHIPLWVPQLAIVAAALGCFAYALRDLVLAVGDLRRLKGAEV
ncbi:TRAP transporter small permease [Aquibaculum arenosum]|uniref:TRAP transporter small permease protein n=1 Tax=Aquibaculum arenosum TaxID=3032591 RepID=A0ABT5YJL5_9PROT|nr:TRAP transporter small permease [Fodinicurvata sp. CAU 1616]MDF2095043.1 TRAP transporter small permease [Fodinicurvata sp. CAU 1616]